MSGPLAGKTALITGGSKGIGAATSMLLGIWTPVASLLRRNDMVNLARVFALSIKQDTVL